MPWLASAPSATTRSYHGEEWTETIHTPAVSDTPASRRLVELIRVINTGNPDTLRAYTAANFANSFLPRARLSARPG